MTPLLKQVRINEVPRSLVLGIVTANYVDTLDEAGL